MFLLNFPSDSESYTLEDKTWKYIGSSVATPFEILWLIVDTGDTKAFKKKDFKVLRRVKRKLRAISMYKDADEDSRIMQTGQQELWLESDEKELLTSMLDNMQFTTARAADSIADLWDIIDGAIEQDYPQSKAINAANTEHS